MRDVRHRVACVTHYDFNGNSVFGTLAIPWVLALTSTTFDRLRILAAIAMWAFVLIAGFSIGLFCLPSALPLIWPERRRVVN